jgi:hypothetical protein
MRCLDAVEDQFANVALFAVLYDMSRRSRVRDPTYAPWISEQVLEVDLAASFADDDILLCVEVWRGSLRSQPSAAFRSDSFLPKSMRIRSRSLLTHLPAPSE